jgi:hypothetical protein
VFAGATTFWLHTQPLSGVFLHIRWDMDASDGIAFSDWYENQDHPAVVTHTYATLGKKTITVEMTMYNTYGQRQTTTKQVEIMVVPSPTASYTDGLGNSLSYWEGDDGAYDRPVLNVEGFDPENEDGHAENYAKGFALAEEARGAGYDVLYLNFANGGLDLSVNKDVFLRACRFAHEKLGTTEAAVQVVGVSMGGTVARYGLAWAEDQTFRGMVTEHYVNTFISFDAPQQGAHLNMNLQNFLRERGTDDQRSVLWSAAARQMLYENTFGSFHDNFYTMLSALNPASGGPAVGYPRLSGNFAVSNGTYASPYPDKVAGVDPLATLTIYKAITAIFFDIDGLVVDETVTIPSESRDLWPGSTFTSDMRTLNGSGSQRRYFAGFPISLIASGYGHWSFNVHFNPSYQPTESALDLSGFYRTADGSIVGGGTTFDGTLVQATTRRHDELTDDTRVKVMEWLNAGRTRPYVAVPREVRAAMIGGGAVQISYNDQSVFEDGVVIERKTEGEAFVPVAATGPNQSSYADHDPSLQPFARYTYRLRSKSGERLSAYSEEVSVVFQPHLLSSSAAALGSGAQRAALQTAAEVNHRFLAYESAGGSYLVRFVNEDLDAGTWENELPIGGVPTPSKEYRAPSLFPDSTGMGVRLIFEEADLALGRRAIRHARFHEATRSVIAFPEPLAAFAADAGFASMPAAAMTDHVPNKPPALLAAAWRSQPNGTLALGLGVHGSDGEFLSTMTLLDGVMSAPRAVFATSPSIAAVLKQSSNPPAYHVYLAWEEENHDGAYGGIRLLHGRYTPGGQPWPPEASQVVWESTQPFAVAQNTSGEAHRQPSVTVDATGNVVLAWESAASATGKILVQKRNAFTSAAVVSATAAVVSASGSAAMPHGASLADYRSVPGMGDNLTVAWHTDGGGAYAAWYVAAANAWSAPRLLDASSRRTVLAASKSPSAQSRFAAATGSSGPPFALRALTAGALPPPLPAPQLSWQTVLINNVKRAKLSWTAVGPDLQAYEVFLYTCDPAAGDCGSGAFHALQSTTTAQTFTDLNTIVFTKSASNLAPDRANYYYVRGKDRFGQPGLPSAKAVVNTDEPMAWKTQPGSRDIPAEYVLGDNFPNPFNPSTTFRFQLPAAGDVRIAVYNMIGEEVMMLVDLPLEAGYHEAEWDASGSPSGVYVAVMRVTGAAGRLEYSAAKKVLFVR